MGGHQNFQKHQSTTSLTVKKGIEEEMKKIPLEIRTKLDSLYGIDTVSDPIIYLNPNLNLNSNPNPKVADPQSAEIVEIIKLFEDINPNYLEWYGNKTQRAAVKFLINAVGFDSLKSLVTKLPEITARKFAPKITTPFELKRDWAKLKLFIEQEKIRSTDRVIL